MPLISPLMPVPLQAERVAAAKLLSTLYWVLLDSFNRQFQ